MKTPPKSTPMTFLISTLFAEDSLARLFQLLAEGADLTMHEEPSSLRLLELLPLSDLNIFCLKMFPDCYHMTKAGHLQRSSVRWMNWGMMSHGKCLTARISVSPNPENACSLSDILESNAPAEYYLSPKQILRLLSSSYPGAREIAFIPLTELPSPSQAKQGDSPERPECTRSEKSLPIVSNTKSGYHLAHPGDSINTAFLSDKPRRGRVGSQIAHTLTTSPTQAVFIDLNVDPKTTTTARCITAKYDAGIGKHKAERSGVLITGDLEDLSLLAEQDGVVKPIYAIRVTTDEGRVWFGLIRKLMPIECWRLQGFNDKQFSKPVAIGLKKSRLYKMAGNAVTVPVISALGLLIKENYNAYFRQRKDETP